MNELFTISDLKTGMRVTQRGGKYGIVLLGVDHNQAKGDPKDMIINPEAGTHSWSKIDSFNNDLTHSHYEGWDIIKVEKPNHPYSIFYEFHSGWEVVWERQDPVEITMAEVEEKFGCKVKIIKG